MDEKGNILVLGPSIIRTPGGIASVIEWFLSNEKFKEKYTLKYIATQEDGSKTRKAIVAVYAIIKFSFSIRKANIIHIHVADGASFWRKAIFVYISYLFKKNIILHHHAGSLKTFYDGLNSNKKKIFLYITNMANFNVCLSEGWKNVIEDMGVPANKVIVMNNAVEFIKNDHITSNISANPIQILFLGRLIESKGIFDLIEAIANIQTETDFKLLICGDGDLNTVRNKISDLNLSSKIYLKGWIAGVEKAKLLESSDILILPSYYEGLPISILEAMANGLAIISTPVGAIPEIIFNNINGLLVDPGNVSQLSSAIIKLLNHPEKIKRFGIKNIELVKKKYSSEIMTDKWLKLYKSLFD